MKISVVIPALDEERGVARTIDDIPMGELVKMGYDVEIIVVDGGSKDRTVEVAEGMGAKIIVEERRGYGRAYKTGLHSCDGEIIATGDADGTYPFSQLPSLIETLEGEDLDFITTNRFGLMEEGAMSPLHKFGNWILNLALKILHRIHIEDSQSGMWVFRRKILSEMDLISDGMSFSEEIKIEAFNKFRSKEVPITYGKREKEEKKLRSWRDGFSNLIFLFKKRVNLLT